MAIGRRKAIIILSCIGIVGVALTLKLNFIMIMCGRCIYGFVVGTFSTIIPRFLEETSPAHLYDMLGPTYCFSKCLGEMFAYFLGALLPDDTNHLSLYDTRRWLFIYAFPIVMFSCTILGMLFVIKQDSIKFLVVKGNTKEAMKHIKAIYKNAQTEQ